MVFSVESATTCAKQFMDTKCPAAEQDSNWPAPSRSKSIRQRRLSCAACAKSP